MPLGILNNLSLVNRDHQLAGYLYSWYLALPHFAGTLRWQDIGQQQNTGVLTSMGSGFGWQASQRPGGFGACMRFNGTSSFVNCTANLLPAGLNTPITVAFWCLARTLAADAGTPYFYGSTATNRGLLFYVQSTGNIQVGIVGSNFIPTSTFKIAAGVWTHIALAFDGTNARLYVNGILDTTAAATLNLLATSNNIGVYDGISQWWVGSLDDVRVYNRNMIGSEVRELYDNSVQGCPGLLNRLDPHLLSTPTPPVFLPTFRNEVFAGPPMRSPWFKIAPPPPAVVAQQQIISFPQPYPEVRQGPPMHGAPWFKIAARAIHIQAPAPAPLVQTYAPEVKAGPPMKGAPWLRVVPASPAPPPAPVVVVPQSYAAEVHGGPPLPGAPWFRNPFAAPTNRGGLPPAPPAPAKNRGHVATFVQRDPTQEQPLRRFTEIIATIVNSLVGQGFLVQTGPDSWTIPGTTTGLTGTFP
jgi:hypothetical protein